MALTVKVTAMGGLLAEEPPMTLILAGISSGSEPVGSAVTVTAAGVISRRRRCPLTLSQGKVGGAMRMNGIEAPVLLVTFTVCVTAEPPT